MTRWFPPRALAQQATLGLVVLCSVLMLQLLSSHLHYNLTQKQGSGSSEVEPSIQATIMWYERETAVGFLGRHILKNPTPCEAQCEFHIDWNRYNESDAIIFNLPTYDFLPEQAPKFLKSFDLVASYMWTSDIIAGYWSGKLESYFPPSAIAPLVRADKEAAPVVFITSNCRATNGRMDYVKQLMKFIKVDSYGFCLHNKDFPAKDSGGKSKREVLQKYLFYIAFENTNAEDYVSEKIFHAFYAGVVPIYMGAPNIDKFLPDPLSAIKAEDFESPEDLAVYLTFLANNLEEYQKHLAWRKRPPSKEFEKFVKIQEYDARCRLCAAVVDRKRTRLLGGKVEARSKHYYFHLNNAENLDSEKVDVDL